MIRVLHFCLVGVLLVAAPVDAFAGKGNKTKTPEQRFKKADRNADGKLSLEEFVGKRTGDKEEKADRRFKKLDKDQDGWLTLAEFTSGKKK